MKTRMKITIVTIVGMCMGVTAQNEVSTYFQVNADNSNGYVASKIYLKSHSNDRGTGLFTLGQTNNWFIGNPYTDHANSFMIGVSNKSDGIDPVAQKSFAKFYLNANGRVGIGTTSPEGNLQIGSGTLNGLITLGGGKGYSSIGSTRSDGGLVLGKNIYTRYNGGDDNFVARVGKTKTDGFSGIKMGQNGQIDFFGKEGNVTLDEVANSNQNIKLRIDTKGNVGIGTINPSTKLDVASNSFGLPATSGSSPNGFLRIGFTDRSWGGTEILSGIINSHNQDYAGYIQAKNPINYSQNRTFLINPQGGKVGIGTENIPSEYKLAVAGKTITEEVKVQLRENWPDFVFEKNYNLPTLTEVEKHIKEKGHLKDIPSAKDVEKNGFFLGEMDAKLLQKIEELTLYTLEQEKRLKEQDKKFEKQEKELKELKILVKRLLEK
ncbi:hypothetical protein SAMN04487765_0891 [Tenacibaculum sp. MAR_2010_89]|uniref:hypothetical protein n=1 Tax=Tenacibaculum sp. MAR_2010_89 TaxID=1250198 RepID=UPI00089B3111|nr:hypothetical protein [Tenacibaculum sp. MAR_2010_89]SED94903.1 hypothetical protein SAMN04487765_0891 [Tenacibaculum sp. MAR_2010_89]